MLTDLMYNRLKWIALLFLPALSGLVGTIGQSLNWDNTGIAVIIINAIAVFVGAIIKVSTDYYNNLSD